MSIKITPELMRKNSRLTDFEETKQSVLENQPKKIPENSKKDKSEETWL